MVVLDEPDSNLDAVGTMALARAVQGHKEQGGAAIIVAHRQSAFAQCDQVYLMEGGHPVPAARPQGAGAAPAGSGKREEEERPSARSLAGPR